MRPKTIPTMAIAFGDCSTTRLKAATIGLEKPTFTGSLKSAIKLLTNALHKACRLPVNTAACLQIGLLGVRRFLVLFTRRDKLDSSLLLGAYGALMRQVAAGRVEQFPRREMLDLVVIDGQARGIVVRNLLTGAFERYEGDAVVLATGGYSNVYYLSTNGKNSNVTAAWRAHKRGALFANPCFTQIHPTCIPVASEFQSKLTLMSESLRNDGRVWVPKEARETRSPQDIPECDRDYYLETRYPTFGNLVPRDVASRNAKQVIDEGRGVGKTGLAVYLDFRDAIAQQGKAAIESRYGNLFEMYQRITGEDPYAEPMRIYPAVHYTMGGLWVDYHLMSTVPGLFVLGEANFSDHGANRLGASALMQGLADGYFIIPYTLGNYIATTDLPEVTTDDDAFGEAEASARARTLKLLSIKGDKTMLEFHRELGHLVWNGVGINRSRAQLEETVVRVRLLRQEFWQNLRVPGEATTLNKNLEFAGRLADFMELGEVMARDALDREESCGCHFREEFQTVGGEAKRRDEQFSSAAAWRYRGDEQPHELVNETLAFENVELTQRSYQ